MILIILEYKNLLSMMIGPVYLKSQRQLKVKWRLPFCPIHFRSQYDITYLASNIRRSTSWIKRFSISQPSLFIICSFHQVNRICHIINHVLASPVYFDRTGIRFQSIATCSSVLCSQLIHAANTNQYSSSTMKRIACMF